MLLLVALVLTKNGRRSPDSDARVVWSFRKAKGLIPTLVLMHLKVICMEFKNSNSYSCSSYYYNFLIKNKIKIIILLII